jgi:hypothetical protein
MAEVSVAQDSKTPEPKADQPETRERYERPSIEMFPPMSNVAFTTNVTVTLVTISG